VVVLCSLSAGVFVFAVVWFVLAIIAKSKARAEQRRGFEVGPPKDSP
jgi:formate hydrogenlyase subunit 4